jgi:hypothetical protein
MTEPTIAAAAGHAAGGRSEDGRGKAVEAAMAAATEQALAEGVTDPDEIRRRKLAARDAVRAGMNTRTRAPSVGRGDE